MHVTNIIEYFNLKKLKEINKKKRIRNKYKIWTGLSFYTYVHHYKTSLFRTKQANRWNKNV